MASVFATRIKAVPWALRTGWQFATAKLRGEPPVHDAALEFVREHATPGDPASVLATLDRFARERRFLMNVGDEKGPLLQQLVDEIGPHARILEMGSFVGYSAILMARRLGADGRLVSMDISATSTRVATEMVRFAGLDGSVTFLNGSASDLIPTLGEPFDLVFLDHWKGQYLADTEAVLNQDLLTPTGVVVADNVGPLFGHNPYVDWMQARDDFTSEYIQSHVEYGDIEDGVLISRRHAG